VRARIHNVVNTCHQTKMTFTRQSCVQLIHTTALSEQILSPKQLILLHRQSEHSIIISRFIRLHLALSVSVPPGNS